MSNCFSMLRWAVFDLASLASQLLGPAGMRSDAEISKVSVWQLFQAAPESEVCT